MPTPPNGRMKRKLVKLLLCRETTTEYVDISDDAAYIVVKQQIEGKNYWGFGSAKRAPEDKPDRVLAEHIAFRRAMHRLAAAYYMNESYEDNPYRTHIEKALEPTAFLRRIEEMLFQIPIKEKTV